MWNWKKVAAAIALAAMLAAPARAEIDLSGMSLAELIELQQRVTMAMWGTEEWQEVTVPAGAYEIGKDIPAGYWTIRPVDGETAEVQWGSALDISGTDIGFRARYAYEQITSPTDIYAKYNNIDSVSWDLTDGTFIVIQSSAVVFTPFAGHSFEFK